MGLAGGLLASEAGTEALARLVLPAVLRRESAWMFGLVLSSWVVRSAEPLAVAPSEHPDRVEAVVVTVADPARHGLWTAPILRSPARPPRLGRWSRCAGLAGRFVEPLRRAICQQG